MYVHLHQWIVIVTGLAAHLHNALQCVHPALSAAGTFLAAKQAPVLQRACACMILHG